MAEIIDKVNDLFDGDFTEGKLLESGVLVQQAANNTKEQFANPPDLANELLYAIMNALAADTTPFPLDTTSRLKR